ncbi:acyl carrier protein [uncultured Bacteroides sp.]|uniref:acyl carrier protein n=1 Tax=uncultured Bacteroides sp. TaxID=162156 RepID=UPI002AA88BFA|nr:acyl carrier protein [uncultured Bacteroides sp.]
MELNDFIAKFANCLENSEVSDLSSDTEFKLIDTWSSLSALLIIEMIDEEYEKRISGVDIRKADTIADLFNIVDSR